MRKILITVLLLLLSFSPSAFADTSTPCGQIPNLACASGTPATQTINTAWTMATGVQATMSNLGVEFAESDTNPTCAAGNFNVYADLSENKIKKCENGTVSDVGSGGAGSTAWSSLQDPSGNLSLVMGANTSTFTFNATTGANNLFTFTDTTSNTGTGYLVDVHTAASSAAKPIAFTAGGTANGVDMSTAGLLAPKGTGGIQASDVVCTDCVGATDVASGALLLNEIGNPGGSTSFTMGSNTVLFTFGATTGGAELVQIADTTGNTGTGHLLRVTTSSSSNAKPILIASSGANGVEMSSAGVLASVGTGINRANDVVCTTCVGTTDLADNGVDGTKIAIASQAQGDLMYYNGTDWVRVPAGTTSQVLAGGTTPAFGGITAGMIGAGDLANVLVWNEACTASPCTIANSTRAFGTMQIVHNTLTLRLVGTDGQSCAAASGGVNEYVFNNTTRAVTFCGTAPGAGANAAFVSYEL